MESAATKKLPECVDLMVLDSSGTLRESVGLDELPGYLADGEALVWCDVYSHEGGQEGVYGRFLVETFGFDELTVEDCFTLSHLPKVDDYGEHLFVVMFSFHLSEKRGARVHTIELDVYVGENYVVCVHSRPLRELRRARDRLRAGDDFVSAANVAHTVLDAVVDEYLPIMDTLSARSDDIEERLLNNDAQASERALDDLFDLKHLLTALRRIAIPQRDSTTTLPRPATSIIPEESHKYFQDVCATTSTGWWTR